MNIFSKNPVRNKGNATEPGGVPDDMLRVLENSSPRYEVPANLHFKIMTRVRSNAQSTAADRRETWGSPKLAWALGLCLVLAAGAGLLQQGRRQAVEIGELPSLGASLELANQAALRFSSSNPLQQEIDSVNTDVRAAARHLLASVP